VTDLYRNLPAVNAVLADPRVAAMPRGVAVALTRETLDRLRESIRDGELASVPDVAALVAEAGAALLEGSTRPVINATGVVIHTNLGRAPWAPEAVRAAAAAAGYCSLEMDLPTGARGGRLAGVRALLCHLTGAEDALVVNNCAAAVLLALTALARDRDVVVSRGELVEIGGSFRVPDVVASGGATLVGVGTTNRTRIADYAAAIGPRTAVLLRVHPSNFRVVGFTGAVSRRELVDLAAARGLLVVEDIGSGSLQGTHGEPSVREAVAEGVDVATFSGDKLLGGPQAGIVVGRSETVGRLRRHSMYRALRVDKVTLAALEATLALHASDRPTPVERMLGATPEALAARATALEAALRAAGVACERRADSGWSGGGALAGIPLPSEVVVVLDSDEERLAAALRMGTPPVVARVGEGVLKLDVRTLEDEQIPVVARRVADAVNRG